MIQVFSLNTVWDETKLVLDKCDLTRIVEETFDLL